MRRLCQPCSDCDLAHTCSDACVHQGKLVASFAGISLQCLGAISHHTIVAWSFFVVCSYSDWHRLLSIACEALDGYIPILPNEQGHTALVACWTVLAMLLRCSWQLAIFIGSLESQFHSPVYIAVWKILIFSNAAWIWTKWDFVEKKLSKLDVSQNGSSWSRYEGSCHIAVLAWCQLSPAIQYIYRYTWWLCIQVPLPFLQCQTGLKCICHTEWQLDAMLCNESSKRSTRRSGVVLTATQTTQ